MASVDAIDHGWLSPRSPALRVLLRGTHVVLERYPALNRELKEAFDALEPPGRLLDLRAAGLDDFVANGVMVAETALICVEVSGAEAVSAVGPHLATVMVEPRVVDALRVHCVAPEHEHHWDILAAGSIEPVRGRCTELARLCREAA